MLKARQMAGRVRTVDGKEELSRDGVQGSDDRSRVGERGEDRVGARRSNERLDLGLGRLELAGDGQELLDERVEAVVVDRAEVGEGRGEVGDQSGVLQEYMVGSRSV